MPTLCALSRGRLSAAPEMLISLVDSVRRFNACETKLPPAIVSAMIARLYRRSVERDAPERGDSKARVNEPEKE